MEYGRYLIPKLVAVSLYGYVLNPVGDVPPVVLRFHIRVFMFFSSIYLAK